MKHDTEIISVLKNVVNYARAFGAEYGVKFVDVLPNNFIQDLMS